VLDGLANPPKEALFSFFIVRGRTLAANSESLAVYCTVLLSAFLKFALVGILRLDKIKHDSVLD